MTGTAKPQAIACRVEPTTYMNAVLLKSQRRPVEPAHRPNWGNLAIDNSREARAPLLGDVLASYRRLRALCDIVVVEGGLAAT